MPKSSAEASRERSCDLHAALMSVPSAPSGHIPEREEREREKREREGGRERVREDREREGEEAEKKR